MKNKKAFTLIELLVVIVIIGILAAMAVGNYIRMVKRAKEASLKANMHTVHTAVEIFSTMSHGVYPGGINTKVSDVNPDIQGSDANKSIAAGATKPPFPAEAILSSHTGFKNPFSPVNDAINNLFTGPPAVPPSGCVYYTGYKQDGTITAEGEAAYSYKICAFGAKGPLDLILP